MTDEKPTLRNNGPYTIGLTGNIATGKSTVGKMLVDLGAQLIDADKIAHQVMEPGGPAYNNVVETFGEDILAADGTIDRKILGSIVFSDPEALTRLEEAVHPAVIEEVKQHVARCEAPVAIMEAIKLLESGMDEYCDAIWVTTCPPTIQLQRLVRNRDLSAQEARQRIEAQPPQLEKIARADVVIHTDCPLEETQATVQQLWYAQILLKIQP
ncbi:MAG: dephospho-CoA kinase [Anaerolineae bacterium]